jgi:hypothetical protein
MKGDFPSISLAKAVTNANTIVTAFDKVLTITPPMRLIINMCIENTLKLKHLISHKNYYCVNNFITVSSGRVKRKTIQLVFVASSLSTQH